MLPKKNPSLLNFGLLPEQFRKGPGFDPLSPASRRFAHLPERLCPNPDLSLCTCARPAGLNLFEKRDGFCHPSVNSERIVWMD